eukprot:TRINITY_DN22707_c0_g1_i1.p1 TRINITY_DN22707_c0_g1~~TRINITY_DN22707_c0_g1_i1.p1  ORF type:complete len:473 (+),score=66.35 TRINITY_DN22707_c0_g1_i1:95-1420(+)
MDFAEKFNIPFAIISAWPVGPTLQSIADPSALAYPWLPSELFAFTQSAHQQDFLDRLKRLLCTTVVPWFMSWAGFHEPRRAMRRDLGLGGKLQLLEAPGTPPMGFKPLVIILSHWGLDRPRPLAPSAVLVGPVEDYDVLATKSAPLSKSVETLLQEGVFSKIVYISFGTNVRPRPKAIREMIRAIDSLQAAGLKFLWDANEEDVEAMVAKANSEDEGAASSEAYVSSHETVSSLPKNILFAPGVPQLTVLASKRIAAFVTHCGLNSVHEALNFGVPMLGLPFVGDQLVTARLIVEVGAGLRLSVPSLDSESFSQALQHLVSEPDFVRNARKIGGLARRAGGAKAAADYLEAATDYGVAHLQTIVDLQPKAARQWDVFLVLLGIPVTFLLLRWKSWQGSQNVNDSSVEEVDSPTTGAGGGAASAATTSTQAGAGVKNRKKHS